MVFENQTRKWRANEINFCRSDFVPIRRTIRRWSIVHRIKSEYEAEVDSLHTR